jgi:phosphatidylserine decarboxylase
MEMGRFNMGSTVIVLTEQGCIDFNNLKQEQKILFGQMLGDCLKQPHTH